jgi:hypothetical protein
MAAALARVRCFVRHRPCYAARQRANTHGQRVDPAPPRTTASAAADCVLSSERTGELHLRLRRLDQPLPSGGRLASAALWTLGTVGVVTTAPEIAMSLGPRAAVASHGLAESGLPHPAAGPDRSYRR